MNPENALQLRRLFVPVAVITTALLLVYSALNYFVLSRTAFLDPDVVTYWLPLSIALILELAIVLPRLRYLDLGTKRLPLLFNIAAWAVIAAPAMAAQVYVDTASATITHVADASQIATAGQSRYYTAGTICLDKNDTAVTVLVSASGSKNEYLDTTIYAAIPVCSPSAGAPADTGTKVPGLWIGLKYFKSFDNNLDLATKKKLYLEFAHHSLQEMNKLDARTYRTLERSPHNFDRRYYDKALAEGHISAPASQTVLIGHTEPYAPNPADWMMATGLSMVLGLLVWAVMVIAAPSAEIPEGGMAAETKEATFADFVLPRPNAYGLPLLVDLNVGVFIAMALAGLGFLNFSIEDLIAWGGNYGPAVMEGQVYRLFTSQFIHGGIMHLANNMYGLCIAGIFLTPILPNWRLVCCYLVTGLGGAAAGFVLHPSIVSVGASGAILGLWGILVALASFRDVRIGEQRKMILTNGATFAVLTIMMGSFTPGIDNAAHIGGFVTGLAAGGIIHLIERRRMLESPA